MEADARMRSERAASATSAAVATPSSSSVDASSRAAQPQALQQAGATGEPCKPATPTQSNAVSKLLVVREDLSSSRKKRDLSATEAQAEHARVLKSMRQLVHHDSPVRALAEQRVNAAKQVLDGTVAAGVSGGDDQGSCRMRAELLLAALGTPEH